MMKQLKNKIRLLLKKLLLHTHNIYHCFVFWTFSRFKADAKLQCSSSEEHNSRASVEGNAFIHGHTQSS